MNEELKKTVRAVQGMEQYDESVKQVLAHKIILANILVNIEAQKDEPSSYYIQNRAVFYACRMVSSQKERDFTGMNYNDIKKVYTIWICMNQKENSLNYLHLTNEKRIMKIGFDHNKYLEEQSKYILERVNNYDKLYLEFGGKLMFDLHAKRVLPGFDENAKIKVLHKLKDKLEVIICVYAGDIERNKIRGDFGITYDMEVFRLIDDLREHELQVNSVVITRYNDQPATTLFINKLERRGIKVYKHRATKGYPTDVDVIVSDEGYGQNPYVETTKPIVVVTAPGPGSGKLATCLSQLYHEYKGIFISDNS